MFLILFVILCALTISIVGFSLYTGISPMPSSWKIRDLLLRELPQNVTCIYELGSGWGTLAFPLAKKFKHVELHAFELSFFPWLVSAIIQKMGKYSNLHLHRKNFLKEPLEGVDVIVCYLYPGAMRNLKPKFEHELKPGTWIFSNSFSIPGWQPEKILTAKDFWKSELIIYRI